MGEVEGEREGEEVTERDRVGELVAEGLVDALRDTLEAVPQGEGEPEKELGEALGLPEKEALCVSLTVTEGLGEGLPEAVPLGEAQPEGEKDTVTEEEAVVVKDTVLEGEPLRRALADTLPVVVTVPERHWLTEEEAEDARVRDTLVVRVGEALLQRDTVLLTVPVGVMDSVSVTVRVSEGRPEAE